MPSVDAVAGFLQRIILYAADSLSGGDGAAARAASNRDRFHDGVLPRGVLR